MAIAVDRAKARLKIKASNLSNPRIDEYSAKLAAKIKDEATDEEIDAAIKDYDEIINFADVARNDDRIRQLEAKSKEKDGAKKDDPTPDPDPEKDPMKILMASITALSAEVKGLKDDKTKETISSKFANDERVKNIPAFMRKGYVPTSDDDYESNIELLLSEYKPFAEKHKLQDMGNDNPQSSTDKSAAAGKVKEKTAEETKSLADSI